MEIPLITGVVPGVSVVKYNTPLYAQVELTSQCQYHCRFCYNVWKVVKNPQIFTLSKEQAFHVADELIKCSIFSVILSGGEPTLVSYLPELIAYFVKNNVEVHLITNGALLSKPLLRDMLEAQLHTMQISMHHYEQEKCNDITQHSNSFNLTLKGIQNAIEIFGHDHVNVNMVVMKDTVSDVSPMGQFLQRHGVYNFSVGMVSTCGEAAKNVLLCEQPDLVNVYNQLAKLAGPMAPAFTGGLPFCGLPKTRDDNKVEMANVCDAGLAQVVIGPEGNIRPCVELPFIGGNIFDDDLGTIWRESEVFNQIRRFENTPVSCRSCTEVAYCHGGCRASALAYTENPLGYDPMTPISRRS